MVVFPRGSKKGKNYMEENMKKLEKRWKERFRFEGELRKLYTSNDFGDPKEQFSASVKVWNRTTMPVDDVELVLIRTSGSTPEPVGAGDIGNIIIVFPEPVDIWDVPIITTGGELISWQKISDSSLGIAVKNPGNTSLVLSATVILKGLRFGKKKVVQKLMEQFPRPKKTKHFGGEILR